MIGLKKIGKSWSINHSANIVNIVPNLNPNPNQMIHLSMNRYKDLSKGDLQIRGWCWEFRNKLNLNSLYVWLLFNLDFKTISVN